ncbi:MAG: aldehyde ferredoxin oxidoreductase family protein [Chloroflexi bacterium]|nr:aldehyde ferredoxin oxidoreductase family protein [Chloroflexota bacterium]
MAGGYMGKILFVDLTKARIWEESQEESMYRDFLGGYGLGARIVFSQQKAKIDPLGPNAMLGLATGILTGAPAIFGSRYIAVGKSPLTGTWGDANSGGDFGPHLKFAGYDAIFVTGISPDPVYLSINDGKAELKKADKLWGKDTWETESLLQAELGNEVRIACIGPSGESKSLISCIINNKGRAAGRSGLGAVMGSKKLKAIAVRGNQKVPIAHETELKAARTKYLGQLGGTVEIYRQFGTCGGMATFVRVGDAPVKNWKGTGIDFPNATAISDQSVINLQERKYGCWQCPVACGGLMKPSTGQYNYPPEVHKPEYETLASFGSMCLNDNLESIIKVNDICNRYGLDTISAGSTIAFAIECYENGLINNKDTDGIELRWGNHKAIVEMTEKLAKREGIGKVLADGVKMAAQQIGKGAEEFAIHIHGQEVPMHDPKRFMNYAISYVDSTPARHTQGNYSTKPASGMEFPTFDRQSIAGRGAANKMGKDLMHVVSCSGMCMFGLGFMDASALTELINLTTGWNYSMDDLLKAGERIANIRQAFNAREGISTADFKVPGRIAGNPPLEAGPTAGKSVDFNTLLRDYLVARDWDTSTSKPSKKKLLELGLDDVAQALWG